MKEDRNIHDEICSSKINDEKEDNLHRQRDTYSKESSLVLHTGNCSSNDIKLYSTRQVHGSVIAACTENTRRDSFHAIPMTTTLKGKNLGNVDL